MNEPSIDELLDEKMSLVERTGEAKCLGKGLDIGTTNLVCAIGEEDGTVTLNQERNAFLDIKSDPFTRTLLNRQRVPYAVAKERFLVLGQSAFEFANIVGKEVRRPMHKGMISPKDIDALPVIKLLVEKLVGGPREKEEPLCFSVPSAPLDSELNVAYHQGIFEKLLSRLGYHAIPVPEGLAIVYAELAESDFTGIGVTFGGGMANVCMAYRSVPAIAFSVARSGDWIDRNAADVLGTNSSRVTLLKERGLDLMAPKNREEEAIAIFYRNYVRYVAEQMRTYMIKSDSLPEFPSNSVEMVCAGGTSLAKGFIDIVREEFNQVEFPVPLNKIRLSHDPLTATVRGCLTAAESSS